LWDLLFDLRYNDGRLQVNASHFERVRFSFFTGNFLERDQKFGAETGDFVANMAGEV
jgi:hypothetical protein